MATPAKKNRAALSPGGACGEPSSAGPGAKLLSRKARVGPLGRHEVSSGSPRGFSLSSLRDKGLAQSATPGAHHLSDNQNRFG